MYVYFYLLTSMTLTPKSKRLKILTLNQFQPIDLIHMQGLLFVPFARTSTTQARAFLVVGPLVWMGFLWRNDCSPGFFLTHSTLPSKLFFLAVQESGALLSSNLEGALYKSL